MSESQEGVLRPIPVRVAPAWKLAIETADAAWLQVPQSLLADLPPERIGVFVGSSRSAGWISSDSDTPLHQLVMTTGSALVGTLVRRIAARGPHFALSTACTSSASAISLAADLIRAGAIDVALAGGVDFGAHPAVRAVFVANGLCPAEDRETKYGCLPFDRRSTGIQLGNGAGFLVLARAGVVVYPGSSVTLAGWARGTDPADRCGISSPATVLPRVLAAAMQMAKASPDDLLFLHAHGNGNPRSDLAEATTLDAFASTRHSNNKLPILLTKKQTGHCLGATPAMELALDSQLLALGLIPPNTHLAEPLQTQHLELVRSTPQRSSEPCSCLVSFGLWGSCVALVLRRK